MDERRIEAIKRAVGFDEDADNPTEDVKIISDEKQMRIRIPRKFVQAAKINSEKDYFKVVLEKPDQPDEQPQITIYLMRGEQ